MVLEGEYFCSLGENAEKWQPDLGVAVFYCEDGFVCQKGEVFWVFLAPARARMHKLSHKRWLILQKLSGGIFHV